MRFRRKLTEKLGIFLLGDDDMKMSKDMQKDILLESFNALKTDYEENYRDIGETIGKMATFDIDIAMDMWNYILDSNSALTSDNAGYINDNKAYGITSLVLYNLSENIGEYETAKAIKSYPKIQEVIFGKSANVDGNQCSIISEYISERDLENANKVLGLVLNNKNNKGLGFSETVGSIFQIVINKLGSTVDENCTELLHHWIQQINDPGEKAKANIKFLNLLN